MLDWKLFEEEKPKVGDRIIMCDEEGTRLSFPIRVRSDPCYYDEWTHWAKVNTPVKKRWKPNNYEEYWFISDSYIGSSHWTGDKTDIFHRKFQGVYKTSREAQAMLDKINQLITDDIGEG